MSLFDENEIDFPFTVTVLRPQKNFTVSGDYAESFETVIEEMIADIQLSLKIRATISEDETGLTDNSVWTMFCNPPVPVLAGDEVTDGTRTFIIDAAGEWGSHLECMMRRKE